MVYICFFVVLFIVAKHFHYLGQISMIGTLRELEILTDGDVEMLEKMGGE
uniref:Uncharacterized protein n=1 Tax=viral metagenome TaxID=1070528 RepID=A0A6M3IUE0_9ZZZZ